MPTREECIQAAGVILAEAVHELNEARLAGVNVPSG